MDITLTQAERLVNAAGELRYRRELTDVERRFGDVPAVERGYDAAEQAVADAARPVLRSIIARLVADAAPLLAARDVAGLARLRASGIDRLATALRKAAHKGMDAGRAQVRENAAAQGVRLARKPTKRVPTRKDPAMVPEWLDARSDAIAESVAAQQAAAVAALLQRRAITSDLDITPDDIDALWAGGEKALIGTATSLGRESYGLGRLVELDALAASGEVDYCVYTAILDESTCEVCEAADGNELPPEDIDAAPNDECLGGERCRCFVIAVMRTGEWA